MTSVFTGGSNRKPELENEVIRKLFAKPHKNANVPSVTWISLSLYFYSYLELYFKLMN